MLTPLKKVKLHEEISKQIITMIRSGELKPGDKLPPERVLAEQLNVSRTAIREAMRSLESMGYIESRVGGGNFIKEISLENIITPMSAMFQDNERLLKDLIGVRLLLETEMASLAAKNINQEKADLLKNALDIMKQEISEGKIGLQGDNEFHSCLSKIGDNSAMSLISEMCMELTSQTRLATLQIPGQPADTYNDHLLIYNAVVSGDPDEAAKAMHDHISKAYQNFLKVMK